jgi:hypothetical protein
MDSPRKSPKNSIRPVKAICKIGLTVVTIVGHEQELRSGGEEASA